MGNCSKDTPGLALASMLGVEQASLSSKPVHPTAWKCLPKRARVVEQAVNQV